MNKELIDNLINKANKLVSRNKELIKKEIESKQEELEKEFRELRGRVNLEITGSDTTWSYKRGYLIIVLECYDRLLENENDQTAQEIFDKYSDLIISYNYDDKKLDQEKEEKYRKNFSEIIELKKEIFKLEKELNTDEEEIIKSLESLKLEDSSDNENILLIEDLGELNLKNLPNLKNLTINKN